MDDRVLDFLSGLVTMGFLVGALFFARFWLRTQDLLFAMFAAAFVLLAAEQAILVLLGGLREELTWLYLMRLFAFLIIAAAIVMKNRAGRKHPR